jgi:hypothetical protein
MMALGSSSSISSSGYGEFNKHMLGPNNSNYTWWSYSFWGRFSCNSEGTVTEAGIERISRYLVSNHGWEVMVL